MIINGDSNDEIKKLEDNSIDALVTDPPYGLSNISHSSFMDCLSKWSSGEYGYTPSSKGFMSKSWDGFVPPPSIWKEVYRVLKPGSHGLVFAGSRTMDLMGLSLRIAGFEIRDCISWLYGSGFPKSHDVSKAIDKLKGEEREIVGKRSEATLKAMQRFKEQDGREKRTDFSDIGFITAPSSKEAKQWEGFGTALKPAYEPALLIRKPFKSSVAQNVLEHGTGALNIDGCRIESDDNLNGGTYGIFP
jgi:site-specific DNA-methyltransferase (adenine-specific)